MLVQDEPSLDAAPASKFEPSAGWRTPYIIAAALAGVVIIVAILSVIAVLGWTNSGPDRETTAEANSNAGNQIPAYVDVFLSDRDETLFVLGPANMRNRPSSNGTDVLRALTMGEQLSGRWVRGADPTTRWLRIEGSQGVGYVWERNLGQNIVLDNILRIDPANCSPNSALSSAFNNLMELGQDSVLLRSPFRIDGISHEFRPVLVEAPSRADGSYRVRAPLRGIWNGLRLAALERSGTIGSSDGHSLIFNEPAANVIGTFNRLGFNLGEGGSRDTDDYLSISVFRSGDETVFRCGVH